MNSKLDWRLYESAELPIKPSLIRLDKAELFLFSLNDRPESSQPVTPKPTIMKFGGTSVEDSEAFSNVAHIVKSAAPERIVVVVSAIGGFTDALLASVERANDGDAPAAIRSLEQDFERHRAIANQLLGDEAKAQLEALVADARSQIGELHKIVAAHPSTHAPLRDEIVAFGELLSSQLLTAVLGENGIAARYVDARRLIKTDESYGGAAPLRETTNATSAALGPLIEAGEIPVVGGFIASTAKGATTTLGRGGSDYSAAIIGAALGAREIQIWTDVSGVLTADPRVVRAARTIPVLSYQEAAELAYFGAKVLHPKTIQPAMDRKIPVRVCNSRLPREAGTLIVSESETAPQTIKAIAHKSGITTVQITSARMLGAYGFLRALFEVFGRHQTAVDVVTTSEVSVSLSIDDASALPELIRDLEQLGAVQVEAGRTIVSVVGEGLRGTPGIAARVFSTISDINVSMISVGASSVNLTFMVDDSRARETIVRLHRAYFEDESSNQPAEMLTEEVRA
jgi:aspartate kinase